MFTKCVAILSLFALLCTFGAGVSFADEQSYNPVHCGWARVVKDNVNLYANQNADKVIVTLEKSYYVQILQELSTMYQVTIAGGDSLFPPICGYVRKIEVQPCMSYPVAPTYPTLLITVTGSATLLRLSPLPSAQIVMTATNTQQLCYYGKTNSYGVTWYYVYYCGKFGYVTTEDVSPVNVPLHPTPMPSKPTSVTPLPSENTSTTDDTPPSASQAISPKAEIMLIVFVVLLAVALTLALFLPNNCAPRQNIVDLHGRE